MADLLDIPGPSVSDQWQFDNVIQDILGTGPFRVDHLNPAALDPSLLSFVRVDSRHLGAQ